MTKHQKPTIRFSGFTDDWEQRKLNDLMDFSNGINAPKENYGKGRNMISVMDILSPYPIEYSKIRNSVQVDKLIEDKNKVEIGDLVFVRSSEIVEEVGWAKAYLDSDYALYSGFTILGKKKEKFESYFVELSLNFSNRKQMERKAGGSTRYNVSQTILNSISILSPDMDEQIQIGHFFKQLDKTITLQERELGLLKEQKKGFLQKMFPKQNEKVPELRFKDFTDDWEQRKFEEFTKISQGLQIAISERFLNEGENRLFYITNEFLNPNSSIRYYIEDAPKSVIANVEDILMTRTGNTGKVVTDVHGAFHNNFFKIAYDNLETNKLFLYTLLNSDYVQNEIRIGAGSSTIPDLKHPNFYRIKVKIPKLDEQTKIGNFFKQLDETIALQEQQLKKMKEMKKGFLQKMFV